MKLIFWTLILMSTLMAQHNPRPAHHTDDGFRNPWPGFKSKEFSDFLKWSVVERIRGEKPERPESYIFETIENDGSFLRENSVETTVTWIGHSSLLIQVNGVNILTDPIWSDRCSPVQFAGPRRHVAPGVAWEDMPPIDVVVISHNHYDHLDKNTVQKLAESAHFLVPLGIGDFMESVGVKNFTEMDWWDELTFNQVQFTCAPAQHFSGRGISDRDKTLWSGWVIKAEDATVYYAGDTGYFPGFREIGEKLGPIDIAAIPIGAYLPRWFMSPVHVDPAEAVQAFIDLNAKTFVPVHWGTFELADEPLDQPMADLKKAIQDKNLNPEQFWLMKHGETKILAKTDPNFAETESVLWAE